MQPPSGGTEVVRALKPTMAFYRFLYDTVGEDWVWTQRRLIGAVELLATIHQPEIDIRVLWVHGVPAGFAELFFPEDRDVGIHYFGLMPEFIGWGLGRYFLDWTVRHAWQKGASRLWVNTCDLDHPRALAGYEAAGFLVYDREESREALLEGMTLPQHVGDRPLEPP